MFCVIKLCVAIDAVLSCDCKKYNWNPFILDYSNFLEHEETMISVFSAIDSNYKVDWLYYGVSGIDLYKIYKSTSEVELTPDNIIKNILAEVLEYYNEKIYFLKEELVLDGFKYNLDELMKDQKVPDNFYDTEKQEEFK